MRMPIKLIPQEFIDLYDWALKVKNWYVYMEISRGMYGLPLSVIFGQQAAEKAPSEALISWSTTHSWDFLPWNSPSLVYASRRQFWHQVCRKRKRQPFIRGPQRIIRNGRRLDRRFIIWNHPWLTLWRTICRYRYAKLRPRAALYIQKTTTKTITAHAIRTKTN